MAYLAQDFDGTEIIFDQEPKRSKEVWSNTSDMYVILPVGSIEKLIGRKIKWEDNPVKI